MSEEKLPQEEHQKDLNPFEEINSQEQAETNNADAAEVPEAAQTEENPEATTEETEAVAEETESAETEDTAVDAEPDSEEDGEDEEEMESSEDEDTEDEREERAQKDYSTFSKKDLVAELERLLKEEKIQDIKADVEEIRSEFNNKFNEEMEEKKEEFLAEGGNLIDFHYSTPLKKEFNSLFFDYREKRNQYFQNLKRNLQKNLERRWELIEELKAIVGTEENINTTYKQFKEIQEKWHTAGPIPRDKYNTVWNTYHHHVENFYDFLHLNREFRDLDFKHNLEAKLKIIMRAEELTQEEDVHRAFRELQMLHKMWKEDIGPVAKEYRDEIWDKFSEATKVIHEKRQAQLADLEKEFEQNFEKKKEIIEKIQHQTKNTAASHKAWQKAIKEVKELRDAFFEIGSVPRAKNKEIWKSFKETTRAFNHAKNGFYKNQKAVQAENLKKKKELIRIAEDNMNSEDFETVTPLMKKIQEDWKLIGHVPRKDSDKVWKQFKKACNHYFDRLHAERNQASKEEETNYEAKTQLLEKLKSFSLTGDHKSDLKAIKKEIASWKEIGRVPYNKRNIEQKFYNTLDQLFTQLDLGKKEKELIKFDNKLNTLQNREDDRQLQNEHFFLTKKIEETKDEIRQLENNLGFFHQVDENNPLVREVHKNIARHKEQLEVLEAKLSKIRELF